MFSGIYLEDISEAAIRRLYKAVLGLIKYNSVIWNDVTSLFQLKLYVYSYCSYDNANLP